MGVQEVRHCLDKASLVSPSPKAVRGPSIWALASTIGNIRYNE